MRVPRLVLWSVAVAVVVIALPVAVLLLRGAPARTAAPADAVTTASAPSGTQSAVPSASPVPSPAIAASPSPAPQANLASRLRTLPAATTQVIVVHTPSSASTYATLETFTKVNGDWRQQFSAMPARIGRNGFADRRTEGDGTTPTGVFGFSDTFYGLDPDPGVRYAYHRLVVDDWWDANPDSPQYNTFQHTPVNPGGGSEALWTYTVAYRHFAVIDYNIPVTGYARGSGVFLHVGTGRSTAGCVSLSRSDLVRVLTWLDPAQSPRIVLSPRSALSRY